jgi:hypothetical protein
LPLAVWANDIPLAYAKVAESDSYELYLYEETMSVILKNKATGVIIRSALADADDDGNNNRTWMAYMQSGLVLTAIQGTNDTYQVDLVSVPNTIQYTYAANGFAAQIFFPEWQFGLTVHAALEGDDFIVWVPDESIVEKDGSRFIGTVSLFPFLGYTYLDARQGYMFIPDGNGALIYLDNKRKRYSTGFSQMIYGNDIGFTESSSESFLWDFYRMVDFPESVVMPVFGMMHTDEQQGYVAIVEAGEKRASIEVHPNGVMVDYNRCFAKFIVRRTYIQPLNNSNSGTMPLVEESRSHSDLKLRYTLLSGESANYAGMAVAYRDYLLKNEWIAKKDTGYRTRVDFLGSDREQFLTGTRAVAMTTTDHIREIYESFQAAGVDSLLTVYLGWQKGGLYRVPIHSYKADRAIGGTGELTKLIKDAAENDYRIYLFNDALLSNEKTNTGAAFNVVKRINKRRLRVNTWQQVYRYFNYLLPEKTDQALDKFSKSYLKSGNHNLALAGIQEDLFSYSNSGQFYSRFDTAASYQNTVSKLSDEMNLVMERPFAYLWKHTDAYLGMPLSSSHYMYEDESVPFMAIVLKGIIPMYSDYVNFEANKHEFNLKMAETGVYPSFYLTYKDSAELIYTNSSQLFSTLVDTYRDTVVEYDRQFRALAEKTQDALIIGHERPAEQVTLTVYDNGVRVYVNYNETPVTVDGVTVDALDYIVMGAVR